MFKVLLELYSAFHNTYTIFEKGALKR